MINILCEKLLNFNFKLKKKASCFYKCCNWPSLILLGRKYTYPIGHLQINYPSPKEKKRKRKVDEGEQTIPLT
jgi:hypothetical protein